MSGTNVERITTVLVAAFASQTDLERMARYALDIALDEKIDVQAGRDDQVFHLVQWARRQRMLDRLVAKAAELNPGFPALKALAADMAQQGLDIGSVPDAAAALPWNPASDGFAMFCDRTPQWRNVRSWAAAAAKRADLPARLARPGTFLLPQANQAPAGD